MALVGGWNETSELPEDVYNLVVSLKEGVEGHAQATFEIFHPVKYRQQVVAGMNYWVKVQVGESTFIHVKIFKPLPHTGQPPQVSEVHSGKSADDEL